MTNHVPAGPLGEAPMSDDLDLAQSVAGEEDPGASLDLAEAAAQPGKSAGTPATGGDACPNCGGSGRAASGACPVCAGTGKITVGIGGA